MKLSEIKDKYNTKDGSMYGKKNIEESIAMLYHENSKFTTHTIRTQGEKIGGFNNPYVVERQVNHLKVTQIPNRLTFLFMKILDPKKHYTIA